MGCSMKGIASSKWGCETKLLYLHLQTTQKLAPKLGIPLQINPLAHGHFEAPSHANYNTTTSPPMPASQTITGIFAQVPSLYYAKYATGALHLCIL